MFDLKLSIFLDTFCLFIHASIFECAKREEKMFLSNKVCAKNAVNGEIAYWGEKNKGCL